MSAGPLTAMGRLRQPMKSDAERCAEYQKFNKIDAAFRVGDLAALRAAVEDPGSVPNGPMPLAIGRCLEYAIYHSPLPFIRTLLQIGADPNPEDHAGFPPLIAALSCSQRRSGAPGRPDVADVIKLLLSFGADPNQRGLNDYTPLHMAVCEQNLPGVELLLEAGADPRLRTRIDDCETPREMAEKLGLPAIAELLAAQETRLEK
jgi:ankyrin repeat protein